MKRLNETMPCDTTADDLWRQLRAERQRRAVAEAEVATLRLLGSLPLHNPNPVLRLGAAGNLEFANEPALSLRLEFEQPGPSRLRTQLVEVAQQAFAKGETVRHTLTVGRQHLAMAAVPMSEDAAILLYFNDLTDLHQAETQLQEQFAFYETLLGYLPAVVVMKGPDQRYRFLNHYAAPDPGERQARIGTTFGDYCTRHKLPRKLDTKRRRLFEQAARERRLVTWEEEWPATPSLGPGRYWQCYYQPMYGPGNHLQAMMCFSLDVTTQRAAEARSRVSEAAVRAQQAFTAQVLDLNPNIIYVRDENHNFVFVNQALQELRKLIWHHSPHGRLTPDSPNGPGTSVSAAEMAAYAAVDDEVRRTNAPVYSEDRLTLGNGELLWFKTVKCLLPTPEGAVHVLGVSTDITALKQAQHTAEAAATARENFLANMSHEIRTPLNGVLGMATLLAKTGLSAQQRNFVGVIEQSGQHLLGVVNDVLDMAKITSGELELDAQVLNLCDCLGQAVGPLAALAAQKNIAVVATPLRDSCPHPWVVGDAQRLRQIFINLVGNAVKFTPAGGRIGMGGHFVGETADTLTVEFRVTDTGIGIAPDKLESIFQEFTQAYADTSRQFGGTGLGLSISRALVRQLGGRLAVTSELGQGSTFTFEVTLPKASPAAVAAARQLAAAPPVAASAGALTGRRVLLVEDNAVNREVAQLLLESHGVVVDTAEDGHQALEKFGAARYDLVLMDIQMPGMNGLEATAGIRRHPDAARAATPVLALTANAFKADTEKYLAAGMNDALAKPFAETELVAKLVALLGAAAPVAPSRASAPASAPRPPRKRAAKAAAVPVFDLALLHETANGRSAFVQRVLTAFRANTPLSLNALWAAVGTADLPAAAALAHKLRPSLQLVGATGLVPLMALVEDEAGSVAARTAAATALAEGLETLLAALPETAG